MALTITKVNDFVVGDRMCVIADVTFDSSYTTGGLSLTASNLGLFSLDIVDATMARGSNDFAFDYTNNRLLAFSGASEVTNATNLSTVTSRIMAIGKGQGL